MVKVGYWLADLNVEAGGVSAYAWRLLETLLSRLDECSVHVVVLCSLQNEAPCNRLLDQYPGKARTCLIPMTWQAEATLLNRTWRRIRRLAWPQRFLEHLDHPWYSWFDSLQIDLLHIPNPVGPPLPLPCPFIFTPHDFQELHFPEFFSPRDRAARAVNNFTCLEACSAAIASFPFIKEDLQKYFHVPDEKIHVCSLPFQQIRLQTPTQQENEALANKYSRWKDFLLYPAQTWQHKNHRTLIRAIQHIKEQAGRQVQLICTGRKTSEFYPVIESDVARFGLADQIHFMDIVPEPELYWLYKNCSLVVIPTLYEAGCFPLLEAMFLQAPVICSSATHLPDTIQDRRFIFDPCDAGQLARLILRGLEDAEFRNANLANSRGRTEELKQVDPFPCILRAWDAVLAERSRTTPGQLHAAADLTF